MWLSILAIVAVLVLLAVLAFAFLSRTKSSVLPSQSTSRALHAPANLYATGTKDGGVLLSWQPSQPDPVGYRIYRSKSRYGPYALIGAVNAPDLDTFTDNRELTPGTTYAYTVTAFDRQGESPPVGPIIVLISVPVSPSATQAIHAPPTFGPVSSAASPVLVRSFGAVGVLGSSLIVIADGLVRKLSTVAQGPPDSALSEERISSMLT